MEWCHGTTKPSQQTSIEGIWSINFLYTFEYSCKIDWLQPSNFWRKLDWHYDTVQYAIFNVCSNSGDGHLFALCRSKQKTHTHSILTTIFPSEPGLAGCPLILLLHLFLDWASFWDKHKLYMSCKSTSSFSEKLMEKTKKKTVEHERSDEHSFCPWRQSDELMNCRQWKRYSRWLSHGLQSSSRVSKCWLIISLWPQLPSPL